jgi:hypothetical protein
MSDVLATKGDLNATLPWSPGLGSFLNLTGVAIVSSVAYRRFGRIYCQICFTGTATGSGLKRVTVTTLPVSLSPTFTGQIIGLASGRTLAQIPFPGMVSYDTVDGGPYIMTTVPESTGTVLIYAEFNYANPSA